jgi:hypothetical protein
MLNEGPNTVQGITKETSRSRFIRVSSRHERRFTPARQTPDAVLARRGARDFPPRKAFSLSGSRNPFGSTFIPYWQRLDGYEANCRYGPYTSDILKEGVTRQADLQGLSGDQL